MISNLTMQQKIECVLIHLKLNNLNLNVLRRGLMARQRNTFKYPVGNGIPNVVPGRHAFATGSYVKKNVFEEHLTFNLSDLNGKNVIEFIKRSIIKLSVESGKKYLSICALFDSNKNGTLEPNEIWHWFNKLAPDGLLTPIDFRTLVIPQLFGLKSTDVYSPEAIARLSLSYDKFVEWVMDAEVLKEEYSSFEAPTSSKVDNTIFLTPAPNEVVDMNMRRRSLVALKKGINYNQAKKLGGGSDPAIQIRQTKASLLRKKSSTSRSDNSSGYMYPNEDIESNSFSKW